MLDRLFGPPKWEELEQRLYLQGAGTDAMLRHGSDGLAAATETNTVSYILEAPSSGVLAISMDSTGAASAIDLLDAEDRLLRRSVLLSEAGQAGEVRIEVGQGEIITLRAAVIGRAGESPYIESQRSVTWKKSRPGRKSLPGATHADSHSNIGMRIALAEADGFASQDAAPILLGPEGPVQPGADGTYTIVAATLDGNLQDALSTGETADDHGDTIRTATRQPLSDQGSISWVSSIATPDDVDVFALGPELEGVVRVRVVGLDSAETAFQAELLSAAGVDRTERGEEGAAHAASASINDGESVFLRVVSAGGLTGRYRVEVRSVDLESRPRMENAEPLAADDYFFTSENASVRLGDVRANDIDPDGDPLDVESFSQPGSGAVTYEGEGVFHYTPNPGFHGEDVFTYALRRQPLVAGGQASMPAPLYEPSPDRVVGHVKILVSNVNDAPVALADSATTVENVAVEVSVLDNDSDPEGDALYISGFTQPAHGSTVHLGDGVFRYMPDPDYHGDDGFSYTVSDVNGASDQTEVAITVGSVNAPPSALDDTLVTDEDTPSVIADVLANDGDPEGDTLFVAGFTQPMHGTVAHEGGGAFTYIPEVDYFGSDTFTYTVADGNGGFASGSVSISVLPINDSPVANVDEMATVEDTPAYSHDVLANDVDADQEALFVTGFTQPAHGSVEYVGDGVFLYTPDSNYFGPDHFNYTVADAEGASDATEVSISVAPVNEPPSATDDALLCAEDTPATTADLTANDSDPDGDALTVVDFTQPLHGTAVHNGDGTFTYTPAENYHGPDAFSYSISDGQGETATGAVNIAVQSVNDPPAAVDDILSAIEDIPAITGNVLANDSDDDGDPLEVESFTQPEHGTVTYDGQGVFTYESDDNYSGLDAFRYTVSDGNGAMTVATVQITVEAVNDAPTAASDSFTVIEDTPTETASVFANDGDVDGDPLAVESFTQPTYGTLSYRGGGVFLYTPSANYHGSDSFEYTVSDGNEKRATALVSMTVTSVNDSPVAGNDILATPQDTAATTADVLANDSDADGDPLTIVGFTEPMFGSVENNGDGTFTYTPLAGYHGADVFEYTVGDETGATATGSVLIVIAETPPQA